MKSLKKRFAALGVVALASLSLVAVAAPASAADPTVTFGDFSATCEGVDEFRLIGVDAIVTIADAPGEVTFTAHVGGAATFDFGPFSPLTNGPDQVVSSGSPPANASSLVDGNYTVYLTASSGGSVIGTSSTVPVTCGTTPPPPPASPSVVDGTVSFTSTTCESIDYSFNVDVPTGSSLPVGVVVAYGAGTELLNMFVGAEGVSNISGSAAMPPGEYGFSIVVGSAPIPYEVGEVTVAECSTPAQPNGGGEEPQAPDKPVVNNVGGPSAGDVVMPSGTTTWPLLAVGAFGLAALLLRPVLRKKRETETE